MKVIILLLAAVASSGCAQDDGGGPLAAGDCGDFVVLSTQYEIVADETVVIEDCYDIVDDDALDLSGCCPDGYVAVGLADSGTNVVCQGVCS